MDSSIISIIIVLITMGLFVWNRLPISVVAILGSVAMAMFILNVKLAMACIILLPFLTIAMFYIDPQYIADSAQQAGRW